MSPDIEWRMGDTADEEMNIRATPLPALQRATAVFAAVSPGPGPGVIHAAIPEPPPRAQALLQASEAALPIACTAFEQQSRETTLNE